MPTFFVEPKVIKIKDVDVSITPLPVKNISRAAKTAAPLIAAIEGGLNPALVLAHADEVIELCAIATGQPVEWVGELNAAELLALLTVVLEVNGGFFSQVIMPQLMGMMDVAKGLAEKANPTANKGGSKT